MNKYSYIVGEGFATLVNITTGNTVCLQPGDEKYKNFVASIKEGKFDYAESIADAKMSFEKFAGTAVSGPVAFVIKDGAAFYKFGSFDAVPLSNAIINRILDQAAQGFNVTPMMNFMANLLSNPEKTAVDELYLFLESCKLPITEDGCFIAYKIVKDDYMDIYTGKMSNKVGEVLEMPRSEVDTNRHNTCSRGLHFCSKEYLRSYGSSNRGDDRCVLVKINPADVVSIPSDYNNAKGRTWKYEVVGEMESKDWRKTLPTQDFTNSAVVTSMAKDLVRVTNSSIQDVFDEYFTVYDGVIEWNDSSRVASTEHVVKRLVARGATNDQALSFVYDIVDSYDQDQDEFDEYDEDEDECDNDCAGCSCGVKREDYMWDNLKSYGYSYDHSLNMWRDDTTKQFVTPSVVSLNSGYSLSVLSNLIS
jgi:hypothetical protein